MKKHEDFMRRAVELALESEAKAGDTPFGSVIVKDGKIVGEGRNKTASRCDPTAHSEIDAIRDACQRLGTPTLEGTIMYTSGEPCPMCSGAIWWAKISRVYYGASHEDCVALGLATDDLRNDIGKRIEDRSIPGERCYSKETNEALRKWVADSKKA